MNKHPVTVSVERRKDESSESLIKRFIKKYKKEQVLQEVLDKRYHLKPSIKARKKKEKANRRLYAERKKREREANY